jgi:hypothetical protein
MSLSRPNFGREIIPDPLVNQSLCLLKYRQRDFYLYLGFQKPADVANFVRGLGYPAEFFVWPFEILWNEHILPSRSGGIVKTLTYAKLWQVQLQFKKGKTGYYIGQHYMLPENATTEQAWLWAVNEIDVWNCDEHRGIWLVDPAIDGGDALKAERRYRWARIVACIQFVVHKRLQSGITSTKETSWFADAVYDAKGPGALREHLLKHGNIEDFDSVVARSIDPEKWARGNTDAFLFVRKKKDGTIVTVDGNGKGVDVDIVKVNEHIKRFNTRRPPPAEPSP